MLSLPAAANPGASSMAVVAATTDALCAPAMEMREVVSQPLTRSSL